MKFGFKKDFYGTVVFGYGSILMNMIAQVILIPLYIRGIGSEGYGVFLLLYSFMNYVDIGVGLFSGGVLRLLGENYAVGDVKGIRNAYTISKTVICGYGVIAMFLMLGYAVFIKGLRYFSVDTAEAYRIIFSAMAFLFIKYDLSVEYQALVGTQRQTLSNLLQMLAQIIYLAFAIPYLRMGNGQVSMLFLFNLIGLFAIRIIILVYHRIKKDDIKLIRFSDNMYGVRKRLIGKMGYSYALYGILVITFQADTFILGTLSDQAELLSIYAMTWKVAEAGRQVLWKIPESMSPYIIEQDAKGLQDEIQAQYKEIYKYMFLLSIVAMLVYGLFGKTVIKLWMGESYVDIPNIRIWETAVVLFLNGIERTPAIYAYAMVRLKRLNTVAGLEVGMKTILIVTLYGKFGISAPLIAMIITHACGIAYAYWDMGRKVVGLKRIKEIKT